MKLEKADYIFIVLSLFVLYLNFSLLSELKQIPSPPYGGDYYNGLGGVLHIVDGGSVLESAQMVGEPPWVPWLYHLSVALLSMFTGLEPWMALVYFSLVIQVLALLVVYLFLQKFTGDKYISLFGPILFVAPFPLFKYSDFATWLIVPAFVFSLYLFMKKASVKRAISAGIMLGLMGLSNTQAFFVGFIVFGLFTLAFLFPELRKKKFETVRPYAVVILLGFLISLLFWFWPIFVYKGQTPNPVQDITSPDMSNPDYLWESISGSLNAFLFPFDSGIELVFTLLNLIGLVFLLNPKDENNRFVLVLVLALLIGVFHPLVTMPVFGLHLMNFMMAARLMPIVNVTLMTLGAKWVLDKAGDQRYLRQIIIFGLVLLALFHAFSSLGTMNSNQWIQYGKTELAPPYKELGDWIRTNTDVNDVFLTTNEGGFMMNALSGRKLVSYRRAHASPYTDMNKRMADQAVMVYGNDAAETGNLLEEYNVKYLIWSSRWMLDEFQFDEEGKLVGFFDPLSVPDEREYRTYWDENGVVYLTINMSLDPAPRKGVPIYDVMVALPTDPTFERPYSQALADHFTLKKVISYGGVDYFKIYEVKK
jgi:hypothetical protein